MDKEIRVLWIVNTIFPFPASEIGVNKTNFGGWMKALMDDLKREKNIKLAIATVYKGRSFLEMKDKEDNVDYFLVPGKLNRKYDKKTIKYWQKINNIFSPDIVHINGTEYTMGIEFQNACPDTKTVVSIQGLLKPYGEVFYAQIPFWDRISNITVFDLLRRRTIFQQKKDFLKGAKNEYLSIKKANAITGRTTWDYSYSKEINNGAKYYYCARSLRDSFYESQKWDLNEVNRHTIFCSQGNYPIKGMHFMIKALAILKRKYPDVQLIISGHNISKDKDNKSRTKYTGYAKYLRKLIKKNNLSENIKFVGVLNEKEMIKHLLKTNVYVQASVIENSPNSLGEAMMLGVPCVASCVGGTSDMLKHKEEGLLYTYTDYPVLAEYIKEIFENDDKALEYGRNSIVKANITHNRKDNYENTIEMYKDMMKNNI